MEKRLLSYSVLYHLKLGKSFTNNCKLCCSVSNKAGSRHITSSNLLSGKHTESLLNEENTEELPISSCENKRMKQLENSKQESDQSIVHKCESQQQELLSFDTSRKTDSCSSDLHLRDSLQSFANPRRLKRFENLSGKCFGTLVHKAYFNLKDNHLLSDQRSKNIVTHPTNEVINKSIDLHEAINLTNQDINCGYFDSDFQSEICKQSSMISGSLSGERGSMASSSPSVKELFNCNMYNKYQCPTPNEEPRKLLSAVVKAMMRADENCAPCLVVTEHLRGCYWKAHLTLSWPHRITIHGKHPDRDLAIHGAFLFMCDHLKNMGLIYRNKDGSWQPMTCEKVMTMLEMLSKYGESSLGCSRGKGFKIVLEQAKEGKRDTKENVDDDVYNNVTGTKKSLEDKSFVNCLRKVVDADYFEVGTDSITGNENICTAKNSLPAGSGTNNTAHVSSIQCMEIENIDAASVDLHALTSSVKHKIKPKWFCTIHVGWPFPFSVQAEGLSLPAAQIMGYMLAVNKIKILGLLTSCNSSVSRSKIETLMIMHTQKHWERSIQLLSDKTAIEKFSADAELFCDASIRGFGAFLSLKGTQKVSWLSEEWEEHHLNAQHVLDLSQQNLKTMLAELFAVVTAVFTWKHKLRSRRLLCFSDNLIVMGFINSLTSEPLSPEMCRSPRDYLIHTLQTTCLEYSIKLQATWLDRQENWLADRLSRSDIVSFQAAVPKASLQKTKAKKLKIREGTLT